MKTDTTYTCEYCDKRFFDKTECAAHEEKYHKPIVPKFQDGDIVFLFQHDCAFQIYGNGEILKNENDVQYECIILDQVLRKTDEHLHNVKESDINRAYNRIDIQNSIKYALEIANGIMIQDNRDKSITVDNDGNVIMRVTISTEPIFDIYNKDNQ